MNRGEREGILSIAIVTDREQALPLLRRAVVQPGSAAMDFVKSAAEDAYDRLIYPSLSGRSAIFSRRKRVRAPSASLP